MVTPPHRDTATVDVATSQAPAFHAARTRDIDEQAALLRGWNQTYDQISPGPFSGSLEEAHLQGIELFREVTSTSLHQTGALPPGTIAVGIPLTLRGNATFCGQPCDGEQLHIFSGRDGFEFLSPCGLDIAGFIILERDLREALAADDVEHVVPNVLTPHLKEIDPAAAERLRRIFADVCGLLAQSPGVLSDPGRMTWMSRDVIAALVAALSPPLSGNSERVSPARRVSIVRDARELVTQSPDGYTSVEDLCRTLDVSRRAVQYSFQETLGIAPSVYLRSMRMNGARRAIKNANSVAEAATMWGFWHFGRFAHDYKLMFGELPSETFRRFHPLPRNRIVNPVLS
jgi:AraC family transcriptional regulator, ethanolamine operon transcriptional activator